jgi:hypothetical protein
VALSRSREIRLRRAVHATSLCQEPSRKPITLLCGHVQNRRNGTAANCGPRRSELKATSNPTGYCSTAQKPRNGSAIGHFQPAVVRENISRPIAGLAVAGCGHVQRPTDGNATKRSVKNQCVERKLSIQSGITNQVTHLD